MEYSKVKCSKMPNIGYIPVQVYPSPLRLSGHAHETEPTVSIQVAVLAQGFAVRHSSTLVQTVPLPSYPCLHAHLATNLNPSIEFEHVAC